MDGWKTLPVIHYSSFRTKLRNHQNQKHQIQRFFCFFASITATAAPDCSERVNEAPTCVPTLSLGYYGITVRELFVSRISHATVRQFTDCLIKRDYSMLSTRVTTGSTHTKKKHSWERRLDV